MKIRAIRPLADAAMIVELDDTIGPRAAARVRAAGAALDVAQRSGELPGVLDVTLAFCSLTLHYDSLAVRQAELAPRLRNLLALVEPAAASAGRQWRFPCSYDGENGTDLDALCATLSLSRDELIEAHATTRLEVYALGFLPGLPFMGQLPDSLSLPRRSSPRARVPQGAVAIAGGLCVIYPWDSPGGWHIVGHCPVPLFDIARQPSALLRPGDRVSFEPAGADRVESLARDLAAGRTTAEAFREDIDP